MHRRAFLKGVGLGGLALALSSDMIARRLLVAAGGGGGFVIPPAGVVLLTSAPDGGWTQKPRSRALWHNGYTYMGFITGDDGDVRVVARPDGGAAGSPVTLHAAFELDTHSAPAMLVRDADHKLIVMYCGHNGEDMYQRISANSLDSDPTLSGGFAAETTAFSGTDMTYPMLIQRLAEASDPIYLFFRDDQAGTSVLVHRKSTDGGATWAGQAEVYKDASNRTYWDIALAPDGMRIDFVVTDTVGTIDQLGSIRHMYADATGYHKSDGTLLVGSQPWIPSQLTLVYDEASAGKAWSHDLYIGSDGNPRFVFGIANTWSPNGGTDTDWRYARWDGAAWDVTSIEPSAGAGQFDPMVAALDPEDETAVYVTRFVSGEFEVWKYTTPDDGATWDGGTAITSSSSDPNIYPVAVKDHPSPGLVVVWLAGTYVSATDNSLGIMGLVA